MPELDARKEAAGFGAPSAVDFVLQATHVGFGFVEGLFGPSIRRRHEAWSRRLRKALLDLQDAIGEPAFDALSRDDAFLSLVLEANEIASRNHDEVKLAALGHAVTNAGLPGAPPVELRPLFLRLVDYLTPLHMTALQVLDGPEPWMSARGMDPKRWRAGSTCAVLDACIPVLRGRAELSELIVRDLQNAGLVQQGSFLHIAFTGGGMFQSRTTDTGRALVSFTSARPAPDANAPGTEGGRNDGDIDQT